MSTSSPEAAAVGMFAHSDLTRRHLLAWAALGIIGIPANQLLAQSA